MTDCQPLKPLDLPFLMVFPSKFHPIEFGHLAAWKFAKSTAISAALAALAGSGLQVAFKCRLEVLALVTPKVSFLCPDLLRRNPERPE